MLVILQILLCGCGANRGRTVHYDGYTVRTEKTSTVSNESTEPVPERSMDRNESEESGDYVLNKNSKRFHDPACPGAADIKESNRWDYHGTRQSILDMGYEPCKKCNP